jgi:hypothetical protein
MELTYNAAYDIPFQHSFIRYDLRMPYANIRNLMNLYVPTTGIRAFLLNHGVNDRASSTSDIVKWHYGLIDKVRQEFNMPDLGWIVALASYSSGRFENVRQAQYQTFNRAGYQTYQGPDLDNISSLADMPDGTHYSPAGQVKVGEAWANSITDAYLQAIQPRSAQSQPLNTISCASAEQLTLSAPSGYEYTWNTGSADRSLTVGAGQYSGRIRASQGTVYFPPAIVVPTAINSAVYGCSAVTTNQAPVANGQLAALSGTVGTALSYTIPSGSFSDPAGLALTYSYRGLPAGLTGNALVVSGNPTTSGTGNFTVTATNTAGLSVSSLVTYTVSTATPQPAPPVQVSQLLALTGQVGQPVNYVIQASAFQDPANSALTFSYQNLPAGLSGSGLTVSGTPVGAGSGQFNVTVTNSARLSVTAQVSYDITAQVTTTTPSTGPFAQVAPLYNCSTGAITFQTTGGNGTTIEYKSTGITDWTTNPNQYLDRESITASDTPPFTLFARQSGQVVTYNWSRQAYCGSTTPAPPTTTPTPPTTTPTPPTTTPAPPTTTPAPPTTTPAPAPSTGSFALVAPLYNCSTGAITFQTTGGNGTRIEFRSPGISDWTTNPNQFLDGNGRNAGDTPTFTLYARQSGQVVTYSWSRQAHCGSTTTAPPTSTTPAPAPSTESFALVAPLYNCSTGAITFQTTGGNGTTIEFKAVGITDWTTNPNQFLDRESRTAGDTPPFIIYARQNGQVVAYSWSRQAHCKSGGRVSAWKTEPLLSVQVLGNPVGGSTVEVLVTGAVGNNLKLELTDLRGNMLYRQQIVSPQAVERVRLEVGSSSGMLLLRAMTPTQQETIKLLKP